MLDYICVPSSSEKGTGSFLLSLLKYFSNNIKKKIELFASKTAYKFYEKNGFSQLPYESEYEYTPTMQLTSVGGKYKKKQIKRKRKQKN